MNEHKCSELLLQHSIKPTANRIVIVKALAAEENPLSQKELENAIFTIDKSNISRALSLFREHHLVHGLEDGEGNVKYELCRCHSEDDVDDDMHVHFYCENCHKTFCFEDTPIPTIYLPEGYEMSSVNYMVKGLCPACARRLAMRQRL